MRRLRFSRLSCLGWFSSPRRGGVGMPRPENPINAPVEALAAFAAALRALREGAGGPAYHRLAKVAHYSAASLSRAASGRQLPSWPLVRAYVLACEGDEADWRVRWEAANAAVRAEAKPSGGRR